MIIWLASYPKSGNTWLRALLSGYFFSKDGSFSFDLLRNIDQYPSAKYFEKYSKNSEYKNFYGSPDDSEESSFDDYSDPIVIAKVIEKAISAKNPKTRYSAGAYSWILLTMRSILPDKWFDSLIVKVTG